MNRCYDVYYEIDRYLGERQLIYNEQGSDKYTDVVSFYIKTRKMIEEVTKQIRLFSNQKRKHQSIRKSQHRMNRNNTNHKWAQWSTNWRRSDQFVNILKSGAAKK